MKTCRKCAEDKPDSDYRPNPANAAWINTCWACHLEDGRKHYTARRQADPKTSWAKVALSNVKQRCKSSGVVFELTHDILMDAAVPTCPVFGVVLDYGAKGRAGPLENSPSIDRLIPELGYTAENIRVISNRANMIKSTGTAAEHRAVADYIDGNLGSSQ